MVYIDQELCINCKTCVRLCPMGVFVEGQSSPEVHPRRRCIQCMHCAGACSQKAIRFEEMIPQQVYPEKEESHLGALIQSRRSIRNYSEELPSRELIQRSLDWANYAPSGKNQRAYRYTVVWGKEQVTALRDLCLGLCEAFGEAPELPKLMRHGTDLLTCGAPCMIVAWSPDDCLNPVLDPAVAMTQLELLLVQEGLGTCWGGYLRQLSDRFREVRDWLKIPEGCHVRCALMVGYPRKEKYINPVWRPQVDARWIEG